MYSTKMRIYAKKANKMIIKRPLYLKQLINRQHNGIIKIISGMTLATTKAPVVRSEVEDASAFGALVMNRFALGAWQTFSEAEQAWECLGATTPAHTAEEMAPAYDGWKQAVQNLM